jgi:hypothetical protein
MLDKISVDLLDHLNSHEIDPANVLLGGPPSQYLVRKILPLSRSRVPKGEEKSPLGSVDIPSGNPLMDCDPQHLNGSGVFENFLRRWHGMRDSPEFIVREIERLVNSLDRRYLHHRGEIVCVHTDGVPDPERLSIT